MLTLPSLLAHPDITLFAACSSRSDARQRFEDDFGGIAYADYDAMLGNADVDAVYVATPHELHMEHTVAALEAGKCVLLEKPMAISLAQATVIVDASKTYGKTVIVGPSHSFDPAVGEALQLIKTGDFGKVKIVQSAYHTNFMYRPRRPEELDTKRGGGVIFSQGAHQFDIARMLAGGVGTGLVGQAGVWDASRHSETAYTGLIHFAGGAVANLTYSGNDFYDSDIELGSVSELGFPKNIDPGASRRMLSRLAGNDEANLKKIRSYQGLEVFRQSRAQTKNAEQNEHFGVWRVSLERADLMVFHDRIEVYHENGKYIHSVEGPAGATRRTVCDALVAAVNKDRTPLQTAEWAIGTLECCEAMIASSTDQQPVPLTLQTPVDGHPNLRF
jgi:phthalate 4,5-cis-dihydrodiol dehydrogenase